MTFCTLGRGWPIDIWPLQNGMSYLGKDGGGGLGSGPGISVGAALALHAQGPLRDLDARRRRLLHGRDRDLERGAATASRCWCSINNNRSYFNDELHQDTVARTRGRELEEPLDRPAHGGSGAQHRQARRGAGRGRHRAGHQPADVKAAIAKGVDVLKKGGVCVIDFHVEPPAERQANHGLGHRATELIVAADLDGPEARPGAVRLRRWRWQLVGL